MQGDEGYDVFALLSDLKAVPLGVQGLQTAFKIREADARGGAVDPLPFSVIGDGKLQRPLNDGGRDGEPDRRTGAGGVMVFEDILHQRLEEKRRHSP